MRWRRRSQAKRPEGRHHPQLRKAKPEGARSRSNAACCATKGSTGNFLKLPVVLSGGVPKLDILIGLLKFFGYHIEAR
jgi:hypothetical protein